MKTIVLTGGGTAGHVVPNLALKTYLQPHFGKLAYIGSFSGIEKNLVNSTGGFEYYGIDTVKLRRNKIFANFAIPYKFTRGVHQAKDILKKLNPAVVFSKGGYVSLPVVIAAHQLGIPVVAHESDLTMGLANKLSKHACSCICTTFKQTADKIGKKGLYTGSPLEIHKSARPAFLATNKKPVLLITGGSLGAKAINEAAFGCAKELCSAFYCIHQVGKNQICPSINYSDYKQVEFADNMADLMQAADIVVCRAGSNTIFELAHYGKPMLLIPLPKGASRGDQVDNAKYFESQGFAKVLQQSDLDTDTLLKNVFDLYKERQNYSLKLKSATLPNGTQKIVNTILSYCKEY